MNNTTILWEETDLTEPLTKLGNKPIFVQSDGISETKNISAEKECEDIGNKKKWKRLCPKCGRIVFHKDRYYLERAIEKKIKCRSCDNRERADKKGRIDRSNEICSKKCPFCGKDVLYKGKKSKYNLIRSITNNYECRSCSLRHRNISEEKSKERSEKLKKANFGKHLSEETKKKIREKRKLQVITEETRKKLRGRILTENHKLKLRIAAIEDLKKKGVLLGCKGARNYNLKACEYFDKLNDENKWNLQHALNGGEIELYGYFVDGYDKENNIVVEYDEKFHYDFCGNLKPRDVIRMKYIKNKLCCRFFRYNESTRELKEITNIER